MNVILASASPRRRELLAQIFPDFEVAISNVDEDSLTVDDPWKTAKSLALAKAGAIARLNPAALVIGGDTVVALDAHQLAKPTDEEDARAMLRRLSGNTHSVITGVALVLDGMTDVFCETSRVTFRRLSEEEIATYVATGEPMDKAGAYAIQGGAQGFVANLEGSVTNVIGLPMEALSAHLRDAGVYPD